MTQVYPLQMKIYLTEPFDKTAINLVLRSQCLHIKESTHTIMII